MQHDYGMVYSAQTAAHCGCASLCREVHSFIGSFIWPVPQHGGETMGRKPNNYYMRRRPEEIFQKMTYHLEREKPFLDPHLSLRRLAVIVGTNTQYLSTSIRICAKMNFRSLINNYRIRYSLELLRQPDNEKVNFRTFHAECGFLSRSAFYMSFKKETDKTPRQFMKEHAVGLCPSLSCREPGADVLRMDMPTSVASEVEGF